MEKLKVVMPPNLATNYGPNNFLRRRILVRFNKKEEWVAWMHGLGEKDMQWVCPWWNFSNMCIRSFHTYIALA